ncbi:MAG: hypothetical protein LBV04_01780 [Deferribacteraceae bacterium]|jgi:hypothetical protein|nr:hypothetical protein [Deferribacteraceae bacterium]
MKKFICVALLAMSLIVVSCSDSGGGSGAQEMDVSISGTFNNTGKFVATSDLSAPLGYAEPAATNTFELKGKLEDGAIIFNLTGTYNSETGRYSLSAGSSMLVYQITGTLDTTGVAQDATVSVNVNNNNGTWTKTTHNASGMGSTVTITGSENQTPAPSLPSKWFGTWYHTTESGTSFMLDAFTMSGEDAQYEWQDDIIIVTKNSDAKYTIIILDGNDEYTKYVLTEQSPTELLLEQCGEDNSDLNTVNNYTNVTASATLIR